MAAKTQDAAGEGECENCGERPATECFENGAELCGPCAVKRFKGQLSDAGRTVIAAPTGETAPTNAQRLAVARQYGIEAEDSPLHGGIIYNASHEDIERLVDALAARVPAPSAPQEPRGEPSEGMRDEALAALERAHAVVSELCDGSRKWIMSIPARPDHDPDLIIGKGIRLARRALSTGGRDA